MADTIDIYGDAAVFADIVERDITEYEDSVIETIGSYAFYKCSSLTSINLPAVTFIYDNAFQYCTSLTSINLPAVRGIAYYAFADCSSLTSINLPAALSITVSAFYKCSSLASINLPAAASIGSYAFGCCSSLTSVNLPAVTTIHNNAFRSCTSLASVYVLASSVCTLVNANAFANTPVSKSSYLGRFGSIYVPSSLVSAYKSKTNWTYYADRITAYIGE